MKHAIAGLVVVALAAGLSACGGQPRSYAQEHYILELNKGRYCIEGTSNCQQLSLIGPAFGDHKIAEAFGLPKGYYAWSAEDLATLLVKPPQQQYVAQALGQNRYRIPPRFETHLVWDTLALEEYHLYRDDDGGFPVPRPALRRF